MRKREFALCIVCALLLCCSGCGSDKADKQDDKKQSAKLEQSGENREEDIYSPIVAKELEKIDKDAEYPYEIQVNTQSNCITVYGMDDTGKYVVPVRAMICSTGENTPKGTFQLGDTSRWQMGAEGEFSQYATRIVDDVVFQSAPYFSENNHDLNVEQFNRMGEVVSGSSIQMEVADAKWIAKNCPEGTKVKIGTKDMEDPLGKPEARTLKKSAKKDPTDNGKAVKKSEKYVPVRFEGIEDQLIAATHRYDLLEGVAAYDSDGQKMTARIEVYGKIDFETPGVYSIAYRCSNEEEEARVVVRNIEVTDAALLPQEEQTQDTEPSTKEAEAETQTAAVAFPTPTPQPTEAPIQTPEPTPAPTQTPATPKPAKKTETPVRIDQNDTTPPQIRLVADSRYVENLERATLAARVRVNDDSGKLQDLYITVQQIHRSNLYIVVYEAVDYAGNGACISETVEISDDGILFEQ